MMNRINFFKKSILVAATPLAAIEGLPTTENKNYPLPIDISNEMLKLDVKSSAEDLKDFIQYNTKSKTISFTGNFNFSTQSLCSSSEECWKSSRDLIKYEFPLSAITPELFGLQSGWKIDKSILDYACIGTIVENYNLQTEIEHKAIVLLGEGRSSKVYRIKEDGSKYRIFKNHFFLIGNERLLIEENRINLDTRVQSWEELDISIYLSPLSGTARIPIT